MASDNPAINFVEYMKGVGDSAVNVVKEGAYGVYDFGQVAVGGAKIAAKEDLSAIGAEETAAKITLEDIEPLSSLGKIAAQNGYQGLGNAVKSIPGNMVNAVTESAQQGDMRALVSGVTDEAFMVEGARAGVVGAARGLSKAAAVMRPGARTAAKAGTKAVSRAIAARGKAQKLRNPEVANKACGTCGKKNDLASRKAKCFNHNKAAIGERIAHDKMLSKGYRYTNLFNWVLRPD